MGTSWKNVRRAVRRFLRKPGFTLVVLATLGVGIGANTAVFSVVDSVLLEPLPHPGADRLATIAHSAPGLDLPRIPSATGLHLVYREESRSFEEVALFGPRRYNVTGEGPPERVAGARATPSLFEVLRAEAALGRTFTEEEGLPGEDVVLLSHRLWRERFGSDPAAVGGSIRLNGVSRTVVGVMPRDFAFPSRETRLWLPLQIDPAQTFFGGFNFNGIGRLKPGVDPAAARRELDSLLPRAAERFEILSPELIRNARLSVDVHPYADDVVGDVRPALWILLGTVGFVLLIACANVANLLLVRAEGRQREVAIRSAMGADRRDLFGEFMSESLVLTAAGTLLGTGLAWGGLRLLRALGPEALPRLHRVGIDGSVLAYTAGIAAVAAVVFGAIPVLRHRASATAGVLRDGTRGSTTGKGGHRARKLLVVSQVAFALILLVGSGLLVRSFHRLRNVDPGFRVSDALTFRVSLPESGYPQVTGSSGFHHRFVDRLQALPGVEAVGATSHLPLTGLSAMDPLLVRGRPVEHGEVPPIVAGRAATPGYFEAMGIPLLEGRMLRRADAEDRTGAVLVSRKVVETFFPDEDPLGKEIAHGVPEQRDEWSRIVGVVGDVHNQALTEEPMGTVYFATAQGEGVDKAWLTRSMSYVLRTRVTPPSLTPAVRRVLRELDPELPLAEVRTLRSILDDSRARTELTMLALGVAALMGLLLGSVGLYGVVSHVTARRTREIGVRMALGAEPGSVRSLVIRQGLGVIVAGLVLGLLGAVALSRFMGSLLYGVSATDPPTLVGVTLVLLAVSLVAVWLPARRAAGLDPVRALRWE